MDMDIYASDAGIDEDSADFGIAVIQHTLIAEAAKWEAHIKLGLPYRTAYEARMRHYLALCAKAKIRAKSIPLVTAFRCGYWFAAGDPVAIDSEDLAKEVCLRKATFLRLLKLAARAWEGIPRDESARFANYAFGPTPWKSGTHNESEEGDSDGAWPDVLLDLPIPD
jgi:hypothetical protein